MHPSVSCRRRSNPRSSDAADAASRIAALVEQGAALSAARFGGEPVQPVGTRAWLDLLNAAIAYGDEAYPGASFPPQTDGARCVLCQQTLDAVSADRLSKLLPDSHQRCGSSAYLQGATLKSHSVTLRKIGLSFFGEESAARRTVQELDAALAAEIAWHVKAFSDGCRRVERCGSDRDSSGAVIARI